MNEAFISLGSNQGDRREYLRKASESFVEKGCNIIKKSSLYETSPWGFDAEQTFYNQILIIQTKLTPLELLSCCLSIEEDLGRKRTASSTYESRSIDVDILYFNSETYTTSKLTIPHPLMHKRRFILAPLSEIAPKKTHPQLKRNTTELLRLCTDSSYIKKIG